MTRSDKRQYSTPELRDRGRISTRTLESNTPVENELANPFIKTAGMAI